MISMQMCLNNCFYTFWASKEWILFIIGANLGVTVKDIDIRDHKLMQLPRKISSIKVKPRRLKILQQRIRYYLFYSEHICGLYKYFLNNTEGYTGFLVKNIKELFHELSFTLIRSESSF